MVAIRSTVGKVENSSGALMNSDVIRIRTAKMIEMASAKSKSSGWQRQDQHHQDGEHADRERDVAAPQQGHDLGPGAET